MAEKTTKTDDVNLLKRRGRRRLVGAIALVLAAVIVLPMVFDSEPKGSAPPVSVRIPSEDESGFTPKVTPKGPALPEQKAPENLAEKAPEKVVEKVVEEPAPAKPVAEDERKRAETALSGGEQFIVQAGAFTDPTAVLEKLKAAKIPFYTEALAVKQGTVTRVRAGPFASRQAAEKALSQLKDLGLKPGNVATKS
jgi:DedD protein